MNLTIINVKPVAREKTMGFVNPGGYQEIEVDRYLPSPEGQALRRFRLVLDIGLREFANVLGVSPSVLSGLENDRATLSPEDWCKVFVKLSERSLWK